MKKLPRNPEKFDVLELFSSMGADYGYDLRDSLDQDDFIERVRASLESSKKSKTTIFGKRVESLFAYVAGALGKVKLLKQEDSGDLYFTGTGVVPPDYRVTMNDGEQFLVEVKNFHSKHPEKPLYINKAYFEKLKKYSELNKLELKFAVYFSAWNQWVLLKIQAFDEVGDKYCIDFCTAMAKSEMSKLGDCMIGTAPNLELHLFTKKSEAKELDEFGTANFITRTIKIYCAGNEVTNDIERRIAFYLIRFGNWLESETEAVVVDNKLLGMKFIFSPKSQEEPNFAMIGSLSTMVSNGFREHTVKNGEVVALALGMDPLVFGAVIPDDYSSEKLPLWRFIIKSNINYKGTFKN